MTRAAILALSLIASPALAADQIVNGSFDAAPIEWWSTQNLTDTQRDGAYCAEVPGGTVNAWDAIIGQNDLTLKKGEVYDFSFTATGTPGGPVRALVQMNKAPWTDYISTTVIAGPDAQTHSLQFRAPVDNPEAQVVFQVGSSPDPWTICLDDVHLTGGAEFKAYRPDTGPTLRVNQLGYLPDGPKRATWVSDEKTPQGWTLRDAGGKVLERGQTQVQEVDPSSGLATHLIDFTDTALTGVAFVLGAGGDRSLPFGIRADIYATLLPDALAYFYPVRSGIEIDGALAGAAYARPAGHIGVAPNLGDTDVPCQAPDSSLAAYGEPWTCDYSLDVSGGWYDAGDHGKYMVTAGISVAQLLSAYERAPDLFPDGVMAIPEAGNGLPDILDEARWELDWMLKMVVPEEQLFAGMYHHKVHDAAWNGPPLMPHMDDKPRELHRPSTAATLHMAAVAAQAARLFRGLDDAYSDRLQGAAQAAYIAAMGQPVLLAPPEDGQSGGGPYDDTLLVDEFFWAGAELFLTTGDQAYADDILSLTIPDDLVFGPAGFDWKNVASLAVLHLLMVDSDLPLPLRDALRSQVLGAADRYIAAQDGQAFGQIYVPTGGDYHWGSNHLHLQIAIITATAWDITGEPQYRDATLQAMDYILGRNALNLSYITGYGSRFSQNQHSLWFAHQLDPALPNPPKGALAGGPNSGIQDPVAQRLLQGCAPQFCYVDDIESWSTNEITINWNAALVQIASVLSGM